MKSVGKFKFKGLVKKDGGKFVNAKGEEIVYKESFALKLDEETDKGIYERTFKIATDSALIPKLLQYKPYQDIVLEFDVSFYGNSIKVIPTAIQN